MLVLRLNLAAVAELQASSELQWTDARRINLIIYSCLYVHICICMYILYICNENEIDINRRFGKKNKLLPFCIWYYLMPNPDSIVTCTDLRLVNTRIRAGQKNWHCGNYIFKSYTGERPQTLWGVGSQCPRCEQQWL